jgi:hypothetical protein
VKDQQGQSHGFMLLGRKGLSRNLGCILRRWLIAYRSSTVRAIDVVYADQALALRATRAQFVIALRAKVEAGLNHTIALRTGSYAWFPQEEIQNNAQGVGHEDGQKRPTEWAHSTKASIVIDISDEEDVQPNDGSSEKCQRDHFH